MTRFMLTFALAAVGLASAATKPLHVTINDTAWVGGNELKPGDYKVEMQGDKAVISSGKTQIQVPAKLESNSGRKYDSTSVVVKDANSKPTIEEIDFGGTNSRLVFSASPTGE